MCYVQCAVLSSSKNVSCMKLLCIDKQYFVNIVKHDTWHANAVRYGEKETTLKKKKCMSQTSLTTWYTFIKVCTLKHDTVSSLACVTAFYDRRGFAEHPVIRPSSFSETLISLGKIHLPPPPLPYLILEQPCHDDILFQYSQPCLYSRCF